MAAGDVDGDGVGELITGAGPGGGPHVRILKVTRTFSFGTEGVQVIPFSDFFAYAPAFRGGVTVAVGDVNGDGVTELITGAGPGGGPHVRVFRVFPSGAVRELTGFFAYDPAFRGGVFVAAGDVDGDGRAEIITGPGPSGGPHVRVFRVSGTGTVSELTGFFPYDPAFTGGVAVGAGDVDGDGKVELLTGAGPGGGPHVRVFRLTGAAVAELFGFFPYAPTFRGGVFVTGRQP